MIQNFDFECKKKIKKSHQFFKQREIDLWTKKKLDRSDCKIWYDDNGGGGGG